MRDASVAVGGVNFIKYLLSYQSYQMQSSNQLVLLLGTTMYFKHMMMILLNTVKCC